MKLLVVLSLVAAASAASLRSGRQTNSQDAQLTRYEFVNDGLGFFNYLFDQSDGQRVDARGELKNQGSQNEAQAVRGSYSWVGPDAVTYTVNYVADENGYQPTIEQGPGGGVPPGVVASLLG